MSHSVTKTGRTPLFTGKPTYGTQPTQQLEKKTQNCVHSFFGMIAQFFSTVCSGEQNTRKSVESERRQFQAEGLGERETLCATHRRGAPIGGNEDYQKLNPNGKQEG